MDAIASKLVKGATVRLAPVVPGLRNAIVVRLDRDAELSAVEDGTAYAILVGYRVRPSELNVSFGNRKAWCHRVSHIELLDV